MGKTIPDEAAVWFDISQVPAACVVEGAVEYPVGQHLYPGQHMIAAGITVRLYRDGHFMSLLIIKAKVIGRHISKVALLWVLLCHGIIVVGRNSVLVTPVDDEQ